MKPIFKLNKLSNCFLEVLGQENLNELYTENFLYTDCITLNLLIQVNSKEKETLVDSAISTHYFEGELPSEDITVLSIPSDGLYKVLHILIPTLEKINDNLAELTENYQTIYGYSNGKIYRVRANNTIQEIPNLNELLTLNFDETVYSFCEDVYTFSLCRLKKCFYQRVGKILDNLCTDKCAKEDVFERDLIWMALNAIQYCLDIGNFFEAQRILEKVTTCNGICTDAVVTPGKTNDCGCHG